MPPCPYLDFPLLLAQSHLHLRLGYFLLHLRQLPPLPPQWTPPLMMMTLPTKKTMPSLSPGTLLNTSDSQMVPRFSPLPLRYFLVQELFIWPLLALLPNAFDVIFLATIERTAPPIPVPITTFPLRVTPPPLVFGTNVASVITGDNVIDSVPTAPVEFAIPLGTLLMTVQLNIFPPRSCPQSLEVLRSVTTRGFIIEPGAQLYKGGNVMILFPYHSILLIVHSRCLLTWRGSVSFLNIAYLLVWSSSTFSLVSLSLDIPIS